MGAIDPLLTFIRRIDARTALLPAEPLGMAVDAELHTSPVETLSAVDIAIGYLRGRINDEMPKRCPECGKRLANLGFQNVYCPDCEKRT